MSEICQDCWEPYADNPLCICRATYESCPGCGMLVFTTPRQRPLGPHTCSGARTNRGYDARRGCVKVLTYVISVIRTWWHKLLPGHTMHYTFEGTHLQRYCTCGARWLED